MEWSMEVGWVFDGSIFEQVYERTEETGFVNPTLVTFTFALSKKNTNIRCSTVTKLTDHNIIVSRLWYWCVQMLSFVWIHYPLFMITIAFSGKVHICIWRKVYSTFAWQLLLGKVIQRIRPMWHPPFKRFETYWSVEARRLYWRKHPFSLDIQSRLGGRVECFMQPTRCNGWLRWSGCAACDRGNIINLSESRPATSGRTKLCFFRYISFGNQLTFRNRNYLDRHCI